MRGSSHLAIGLITGVAIGGLVAGVKFSPAGIALAGFSALAPDLDHPESRLSKRLGFAQNYVRWAFVLVAAGLALYTHFLEPPGPDRRMGFTAALAFGLLGAAMQGGSARKLALLFTGLSTVMAGLYTGYVWLSMVGLFVAVAPFTAHRSWTHTIWAAGLWTYIGHLANQSLGWHGVALFAGGGYASHLLADTLTKAGVKWFMPLTDTCLKIPLIRTGSPSGNLLEVSICTGYGLLVLGLVIGKMNF
ncbi:metal-dependent hydrolase [Hymenobacter sp. BT186]|uniref:Metal-dependent hydrolase n=1 Tax=Hymenobacter telluris TaxID=2816474 RepID=A0A939JB61_9BACT|nr:metal-dependent hydrolase [Hymenobacter telluris]MBO0356980.1 metal-dependent hydrolase [Hymenobacter telluris]MBW3373007.1 metal-dependent hydrolase [Hymenobacter norwichensis]